MTRRRYLAVKTESPKPIEEGEFKHALWDSLNRLFGEYGASKTNLVIISYDATKNYAILRCSNSALEMVRASLVAITEIGAKTVAVHVFGISGTLKSLRHKFQPNSISLPPTNANTYK